MLEIYNETIHDLLNPSNPKKLAVKMGPRGNHVPGLTTRVVTCAEDVTAIFNEVCIYVMYASLVIFALS